MRNFIIIATFLGLIIAYIWGMFLFNNESPDIENNNPTLPTDSLDKREQDSIFFFDTTKVIEETPEWLIKQEQLQIKLEYPQDTIIVEATMYQPTKYQCDDSPDVTADQTKIPNVDSCSHLNWIAVSQDLLWFNGGPISYGDTVYVIAGHKTGYYIVRDAMNKRWTNKIDFLESIGVEAYKYNKAELIISI